MKPAQRITPALLNRLTIRFFAGCCLRLRYSSRSRRRKKELRASSNKIAFPTRPVPAAELTERLNGRVQSSALNRAHETLASTISRVNHFRFPAIEGIFFDLP